jgi:hypothetical protein
MPITIGALKESAPGETRVSLVPEVVDKSGPLPIPYLGSGSAQLPGCTGHKLIGARWRRSVLTLHPDLPVGWLPQQRPPGPVRTIRGCPGAIVFWPVTVTPWVLPVSAGVTARVRARTSGEMTLSQSQDESMSPPGTSPLDAAETTGKLDVAETADHRHPFRFGFRPDAHLRRGGIDLRRRGRQRQPPAPRWTASPRSAG